MSSISPAAGSPLPQLPVAVSVDVQGIVYVHVQVNVNLNVNAGALLIEPRILASHAATGATREAM
jgi:hypothetical protein